MSSLNPRASPFIPLHKQGSNPKSVTREASDALPEAPSGNEVEKGTPDLNIDGNDRHIHANISDHANNKYGNEEYTKGNITADEESMMDLSFLSSLYPTAPEQSLAEIYFVNSSDLEATIDMLREMEDFSAANDDEHSSEHDQPKSNGYA